jgi:hypothetical protein
MIDLDSLIKELNEIRLQYPADTGMFIKIDTETFLKSCDTELYSIRKVVIEKDEGEYAVIIHPFFISLNGN